MKILGIIPARYQSSRFEGKPLAKINGIPMLQRTYRQAALCQSLSELIVATDDERISEFCSEQKIPVIMTSPNCKTGTDRLAEVAQIMPFNLYVNIQGDEPVISPEAIKQVIQAYEEHGEDYIAYNLYKKMEDPEEVKSPTSIKVIVNHKDELLYMSRAPIPFNRSDQEPSYYKQVCVYGFTQKSLREFSSHDKTRNEKYEDIEILRFIDLGYKVKMIQTTCDSIAVDLPSDIAKVEQFLNEHHMS